MVLLGVLMTGRLTWRNATSEDYPYLDGLDCWLGYLADQQVSTVVLQRDSDGNLLWQVSVMVPGGPGFQDLLDVGSFGSLVTAQAAAEQHLR
jgi:hypothetical protein